jgi:hypothetical protein
MYELDNVREAFERIGARLVVGPQPRNRALPFTIDVITRNRREAFELRINAPEQVDFGVLALDARRRHLLLQAWTVARDESRSARFRMLCGHDERHWFVAGIANRSANSIDAAMESLKPGTAKRAQAAKHVRAKRLHSRRNAGFLRQGEWFFIPAPEFEPGPLTSIQRNEPLSRGVRSKPHWAEQLVRTGGEQVWLTKRSQDVFTEAEREELFAADPIARGWVWRKRMRNADVYVRGRVRHSDHATITLPIWHSVIMNTENDRSLIGDSSPIMFLD